MKTGTISLLTVLLIAAMGGGGFAGDIFVAPDGDDSRAGTIDRPLATLRVACARARAGDTIYLRAGTYHQHLYWDSGGNGAPEAFITLQAYDGDRSARLLVDAPGAQVLALHGRQYVKIVGLEIDGAGRSSNVVHGDGGCRHIYLQRCYIHDAGLGGDCVKFNNCDHIFIEDSEIVRPGPRHEGGYQEGIDLLDVDDSVVRSNYLHDFPDMAVYAKGGSTNIIIEGNLISHQLRADLNPATGFGQQTDLAFMHGATYQSYHCVFRNNIIRDCPGGAIGSYDCSRGYFYNNIVHNCGSEALRHGIVHQRTSTTWQGEDGKYAGKTSGAYFFNNVFLDTRGEMPTVYQHRSGDYEDWQTGNNNYYNNGRPIPSEGIVDPNQEPGATFGDPKLAHLDGTAESRRGWLDCYRITADSAALIDRGSGRAGATPFPAVRADIEGAPRPQGDGWDIGPFEHGAPGPR
jgi:hypothetical protein